MGGGERVRGLKRKNEMKRHRKTFFCFFFFFFLLSRRRAKDTFTFFQEPGT